jgi:O-methyltransferase
VASSPSDLRLRIPGFRRYAIELQRLRRTASEVDALRGTVAELQREIGLLRASRGLAGAADLPSDDAEWIERAKRFEYYWVNAQKKIDLFDIHPFADIAAEVLRDGRTYLNADRLYTLWQAVAKLPLSAQAVIEVGTYKGGSAKMIAEALRALNRTVPFHVCDTFSGHAVVDPALDGRHRVGKQFRTVRAKVEKYLKKYDFLQIVEGDIRTTASGFADQHAFGMAHIDVDVHPVTEFCLEFLAPRVVVGATIVVDDYGFTTCKGVKKAVDDFLAASRGRFWGMHLLTGQAVLTRIA